ncbi:MAG: cupin domain-containing protein [Eubacteriales bacterium]|nr:cupin domain-containing protein [Eubacteriales bacterium]MDD4105220.1 cupin domain-containing protein [Eubacteriales bacterium]MDD4710442.1 cupin domain-containing protein [Eubacteriales bacterium]NLO16015.1 cupin domain-containing protein [Clostridiales bacterium]
MDKINIFDIDGMYFPAGRRTRVMLGANGALPGDLFCQGYVVVDPDGSIPEHAHAAAESYTILQGQGIITVEKEEQAVGPYDMVYIASGKPHALRNTGKGELHLMFVYAPNTVAEHWSREESGALR